VVDTKAELLRKYTTVRTFAPDRPDDENVPREPLERTRTWIEKVPRVERHARECIKDFVALCLPPDRI
jgi:hypothetical protein